MYVMLYVVCYVSFNIQKYFWRENSKELTRNIAQHNKNNDMLV